jgi:hypothetical protein
VTAAAWEPGDPLHPRITNGGAQYRAGLFNFRDDSEAEDHCHCPDAASWPNPRQNLGDGDELGDFIARHHAWRRSLLTMEGA